MAQVDINKLKGNNALIAYIIAVLIVSTACTAIVDILQKKINCKYKSSTLFDFSEVGDCMDVVKEMEGKYGKQAASKT